MGLLDWIRSIVGPPTESKDSADNEQNTADLQKAQSKIETLREDMTAVQSRLNIVENNYRASGIIPSSRPRRAHR